MKGGENVPRDVIVTIASPGHGVNCPRQIFMLDLRIQFPIEELFFGDQMQFLFCTHDPT